MPVVVTGLYVFVYILYAERGRERERRERETESGRFTQRMAREIEERD